MTLDTMTNGELIRGLAITLAYLVGALWLLRRLQRRVDAARLRDSALQAAERDRVLDIWKGNDAA